MEQDYDRVCEPAGPLQATANATANRMLDGDRGCHDWYRFVLSFPPHLVREYIDRFGLTSRDTVLDPFCGTGTTLVECKKQGIASVGLEANPLACFAARTKANWTPDPDALLSHARAIAAATLETLAQDGVEDVQALFRPSPMPKNMRTLTREQQSLLLKDSISPLPLHKTLVLRDEIQSRFDAQHCDHELLALAKALVFSISNLHFGPEVGVRNIKTDIPVVAPWLQEVRNTSDDLCALQSVSHGPASVLLGDSREILKEIEDNSISAVITSPPYPNEKDYTRTTRLESVVLGFISSREDLRAIKRNLVRSNTRGVYKDDIDDQWALSFQRVHDLADEIERRRVELGKTSGFERTYNRVVRLYFGGMARHLASLRRVLKPGARLAYVVGDQASYLRVMIRTGEIMSDIAASLGFQVESRDLFRTRIATATKEWLREEVVVLRWPGEG